jgi:hypothetical protein
MRHTCTGSQEHVKYANSVDKATGLEANVHNSIIDHQYQQGGQQTLNFLKDEE